MVHGLFDVENENRAIDSRVTTNNDRDIYWLQFRRDIIIVSHADLDETRVLSCI
jgi:hypothetical protein